MSGYSYGDWLRAMWLRGWTDAVNGHHETSVDGRYRSGYTVVLDHVRDALSHMERYAAAHDEGPGEVTPLPNWKGEWE